MSLSHTTHHQGLSPAHVSLQSEQREQSSVQQILQSISEVLHARKTAMDKREDGKVNFHAVDISIDHPLYLQEFASQFSSQFPDANLRVSAIHPDESQLNRATHEFEAANIPAHLVNMDYANAVAANLRNGLRCAGGADVVICAHSAYPNRLPDHKFSRAVDRLSDVTAQQGALVTIHHHGTSDVDGIRQALNLKNFSKPGMYCETQHRLEQKFAESKMHAFSVTVPNIVTIPNDPEAIEAVFNADKSGELSKEVRRNAAQIWNVLAEVAGGDAALQEALQSMGDSARNAAIHHLTEMGRANPDQPIGINHDGAQVVVAFHRPEIAKEAFAAVQKVAEEMHPPALALPLSRTVAQTFDKQSAHAEWSERLRSELGVSKPPMVCQAELDRSSPSR